MATGTQLVIQLEECVVPHASTTVRAMQGENYARKLVNYLYIALVYICVCMFVCVSARARTRTCARVLNIDVVWNEFLSSICLPYQIQE